MRLRLPTPQGLEGGPVDFTVDSVEFDAGRLTHPDLVQCVRVDVPWNVTVPGNPINNTPPSGTAPPGGWTQEQQYLAAVYPSDAAYCHKPPPEGCDDVLCWLEEKATSVINTLIEIATAVYEGVSAVYNGIITGVVNLIAEGLCGPLVAVAGDSVDGTCQDVLRVVTRAAISAVLAAYGIPPSLPSIGELQAIAEGELDQLAVQLMTQLGVPCDSLKSADATDAAALAEAAGVDGGAGAVVADPCLALAGAALDGVQGQVTDQLNRDVAQGQGFPSLAGVAGASMVPEPTAQPSPVSVKAQIHPTESNAVVDGLACHGQVRLGSYYYFISPNVDVPLVNPPAPSSYAYRFPISGGTVGPWQGGTGINDYYPGSGAYINGESPMTARVSFGGNCRAPAREVTTEMRPADPRPPVKLL